MKSWQWILVFFYIIHIPISSYGQEVIRELDAPGPESRGLAWDGQYLWCADAEEDSVFKIDPESGQVLHAIYFKISESYGGGITWNEDETLWITLNQFFYKLDADTGQELANFHCPGG